MAKFWTPDEDAILYEMYGKKPYSFMRAQLPDRTNSSIAGRATFLKLKGNNSVVHRQLPRKYEINFDFFDEVTPLTCAFAGLLAADGHIVEKKRGISIHLKESDGYLLEQWANIVEYTGSVQVYTSPNSTYSPNCRNSTLTIYGVPKWISQLEKVYNVVPKKSLILEPPNLVKREDILGFMSGYVDGDGSVLRRTYSRFSTRYSKSYMCTDWRIIFIGTEQMCYWFKAKCEEYYPSKKTVSGIEFQQKKNTKLYQFRIGGQRAQFLAKEIGKLNLPRLNRKWDPIIESELTVLYAHKCSKQK